MKLAGILAFFVLVLMSASPSLAHPGNTASDGCHYCRTNCDYWGVPWNERHCHGGYVAPEPIYVAPTSVPAQNNIVIPPQQPDPTKIPTWTPNPTRKPIVLPTAKPTVQYVRPTIRITIPERAVRWLTPSPADTSISASPTSRIEAKIEDKSTQNEKTVDSEPFWLRLIKFLFVR